MTEHHHHKHRGTCRSCGADIEWAMTEAGKRMPIVEKSGGNLRIQLPLLGGLPTAVPVLRGKGTHISHFADCPDADRWRAPQ